MSEETQITFNEQESQATSQKQDLKVWGVKVTDTIKTQMQDLIKTEGLTGNDLLNEMLSLYIKTQTNDDVKQGMQTLTNATKQILNTYKLISDQMQFNQQNLEEECERKKEKMRLELTKLQEVNATLKTDKEGLEEREERRKERERELIDSVSRLEADKQSTQDLVAEYKDKINTLYGLIEEYKGYEKYKKENEELREQLDVVRKEKEDGEARVQELERKIQEQAERCERDMDKLRGECKREMEELKSKLSLENKENSLNLQAEHQQKQQDLRDEFNKKIDVYERKVVELWEKLEKGEGRGGKEKD